jgi:hypothetical protein
MKKAIGVFVLVLVLAGMIFSSVMAEFPSGTVMKDSRVKYVMLPADYSSVGGYSAWMAPKNAFAMGDTPLREQHYDWTAWDLFWPGKECVTVGPRVDKITLFYKEGYKWEQDGSEYCLVKD